MFNNITKMSAIALTMISMNVNSADISVGTGRDFTQDKTSLNLSVSQSVGPVQVVGELEYFYDKSFSRLRNDQYRFSISAKKDFYKIEKVKFYTKSGLSFIDNENRPDGYAFFAGLGLEYPLTKNTSFVTEVKRQFGQDRVEMYNGNTISGGLKFTF